MNLSFFNEKGSDLLLQIQVIALGFQVLRCLAHINGLTSPGLRRK